MHFMPRMRAAILRGLLTIALLTALCHPGIAALSEGQTPSGIPLDQMEARIEAYMASAIGQSSPGAAVVVVRGDEILFSRGYGYADLESQIPVDPARTVFEYGSISKLFVYSTLMRLAEAGKLRLDEDLRPYFPARVLQRLRYDEAITPLHVMNHTTGLEDDLFDVVLTSQVRPPDLKQALLAHPPQQVYRPGTISAYSNYAVALAASVAQDLLGEAPLYAYWMDTIFRPLGMDSTSAQPVLEDRLKDRKAIGYAATTDGGFQRGSWSTIPLYPAGSVNGTAEDLARFLLALMPAGGQTSPLFQAPDTLEEMLSLSHSMGPDMSGFAHGFMGREGQHGGLGHGGNTAYFTAQANLVPEARFGVVVLCNAANEMEITEGLTRMLLDPVEAPVPSHEGALPDARSVEGVYIMARRPHTGFLKLYPYLSLLRVRALDSNHLELRMAGQSAVLAQKAPDWYQRQSAQGSLFAYNFQAAYFEREDGAVKRISGDFLPLPPGHTLPWLWADGIAAILCAAFFLFAPVGLLVRALVRRKREKADPRKNGWLLATHVLCGTGLMLNNGLLLLRMLSHPYRSFSEVRFHILLNGGFAGIGLVIGLLLLFRSRGMGRKARALIWISAVLFAVCVSLLAKWEFFRVLSWA